jgi:hypothetical protein
MGQWITTADVQTWLGPQIDDDTAVILAVAASDSVADYIERDLTQATVTEYYDSNGTDYILLNSWPVQSIASVTILNWPSGGPTVPPAAPGTPGYRIDAFNPRKLVFAGYGKIPRGTMNITVTYTAGYNMSGTPGTPPGLPASIYQALKLTVNAIYNSQAADANLASENTAGVFSGSYYPTGVGCVPPGARSLLANYKRTAP